MMGFGLTSRFACWWVDGFNVSGYCARRCMVLLFSGLLVVGLRLIVLVSCFEHLLCVVAGRFVDLVYFVGFGFLVCF